MDEDIATTNLAQEDKLGRVIEKAGIVERCIAFKREDDAKDVVSDDIQTTINKSITTA